MDSLAGLIRESKAATEKENKRLADKAAALKEKEALARR